MRLENSAAGWPHPPHILSLSSGLMLRSSSSCRPGGGQPASTGATSQKRFVSCCREEPRQLQLLHHRVGEGGARRPHRLHHPVLQLVDEAAQELRQGLLDVRLEQQDLPVGAVSVPRLPAAATVIQFSSIFRSLLFFATPSSAML